MPTRKTVTTWKDVEKILSKKKVKRLVPDIDMQKRKAAMQKKNSNMRFKGKTLK